MAFKEQKITTDRKPLSTSRISSLFTGQYPNRMKDEIAKDRYLYIDAD